MMTYNLHLPANDLTIEPQDNGYYQIFEGNQQLGRIYALRNGKQLKWLAENELSVQFVNEMGALIQEHRI